MRIGLLMTSIGAFGQKGFYNSQEIGLAKAMDTLFDEVKVYKLVASGQQKRLEKIENCKHSSVLFLPAKSFGINGIMDTSVLDTSLDVLIYFSDTQFAVPKVYKWTKKNKVRFFAYIGVIESHSTNRLKKMVVDMMFSRNLKVYQNTHCFAKTPAVKDGLKRRGVTNIAVTPVGLDLTLLNKEYDKYNVIELKKKYGYTAEDNVLLFIGRLIDEKQPVRMIECFSEIAKKSQHYKLLMVGTGELKDAVHVAIQKYGIQDKTQMIDRIPNCDIWELYRVADTFVNLNQHEIFGMAILEAMYYGCKVVAWHAPGPDLIIENNVSGYLVSSKEELIDSVMNGKDISILAHNRIVDNFTWKTVSEQMKRIICEELGE